MNQEITNMSQETNKGLRLSEEKILSYLEKDARMSFVKIGKKIRASEQKISYTVNSLIKKGIINGFYTLVDYSRLNVISFVVLFQVSYVNEDKFNEFLDYLRNGEHTLMVATCGGRYDVFCIFAANNPSQFNKIIKETITRFSNQVRNYIIFTTVVQRKFDRKYLMRKAGTHYDSKEYFLGGDRTPYFLDDDELSLLKEIANSSRKSSVEIGQKLSLSPKTIINKLNKLKVKEVILGFKPFLNITKAGYSKNLLFIRYHNYSSDKEQRLINFLKVHPNVTSVMKTIGWWDIQIEIETEDQLMFRKTEREIREKFLELIQSSENLPIYNVYKLTFFPDFVLAKSDVSS